MTATPAGDPAPFARALEKVFPDGQLVSWDGTALYLPCGDPAAAAGTRIFSLEPGTRPDLPWELEVPMPADTTVVVGTLLPPVAPTAIAVEVRAAFVTEAPDLATARVIRRPTDQSREGAAEP